MGQADSVVRPWRLASAAHHHISMTIYETYQFAWSGPTGSDKLKISRKDFRHRESNPGLTGESRVS